jgi:kynureninase
MLTGFLEVLIKDRCSKWVAILSPSDPTQRGCQLSLSFNVPIEKVHDDLQLGGVICDLRKPNVMRIAPNPLYNTFTEVWNFVEILEKSLMKHDDDPLTVDACGRAHSPSKL